MQNVSIPICTLKLNFVKLRKATGSSKNYIYINVVIKFVDQDIIELLSCCIYIYIYIYINKSYISSNFSMAFWHIQESKQYNEKLRHLSK